MKRYMIVALLVAIGMAWFTIGVLNGIAEQAQKDELRLCIDVVIQEYGYDAARVKHWNPRQKVLRVEISEPLNGGTDGECQAAGLLFHKLCSLDSRILLYVVSDNGYVPSRENPMTAKWTRILAEGY